MLSDKLSDLIYSCVLATGRPHPTSGRGENSGKNQSELTDKTSRRRWRSFWLAVSKGASRAERADSTVLTCQFVREARERLSFNFLFTFVNQIRKNYRDNIRIIFWAGAIH